MDWLCSVVDSTRPKLQAEKVVSVQMYNLRRQTFKDCIADVLIHDLPVIFTGTFQDCTTYATKEGFEWRNSKQLIFGGFWYRKPTASMDSECLYLTH